MTQAESEWQTRKRRIDPRLDAIGWELPKRGVRPLHGPFRSEEQETANGPADYAFWLDGHIVGVVEAKKLTVSPQGVLTQAERYARGLPAGPYNYGGLRAPFLYSTNGEVIWFHDVRHAQSRSRRVSGFHTPNALRELLSRDFEAACAYLRASPSDHPWLRTYQREAHVEVEKAIAERRRHMLLAMATGTGKTVTLVSEIYRLMKAGVAHRVLFLVDRRALAAQAVRTFASFEAEPGHKFDKLYEVYSSRFQRGDFGEEEKFDPSVLPEGYLTDPKTSQAFVYVCTIQRMAINLYGKGAVFEGWEERGDEDADRLDIPIHAFDLVIADECHRGYTAAEQSVWRNTLEHFDAVKIGLTATPAAHTTSYFKHLVFRYDYRQAVHDGHLVDYDVVNVRSDVRLNGLFLREGEQVEEIDTESGAKQLDLLEDERAFASSDIEARVTAPDSNRKIIEELKHYAAAHEQETGRFPKTLIFAANDLAHTSHADQLVEICRDAFGRGDAFVQKITGSPSVDRPLQRIREFRNRPNPGIAVTVDLLTTGVDIPDLEFLVFLRPVKSRILFEQMLGRGTRKGEHFPDKSHFVVFDCFDGSLLEYFRKATGITAEPPVKPSRTIAEIVEDVWQNRDREYNVGCLVKRLHRIDKRLSAEGRELFAAFVPGGDLAAYARALPNALRDDFAGTMALLRNAEFQDVLVNYPRAKRVFLVATEAEDAVTSRWLLRVDGEDYQPGDYLAAWESFVRDNPEQIEAIAILLDRPREWSAAAIGELREKLARTKHRFTVERLQKVHELSYHRALVDIISMVKRAADEGAALLTAEERVERAIAAIRHGTYLTEPQEQWLDRIRAHLVENLSIERDDFGLTPVLVSAGGWGSARRAFGNELEPLLERLNEALAA